MPKPSAKTMADRPESTLAKGRGGALAMVSWELTWREWPVGSVDGLRCAFSGEGSCGMCPSRGKARRMYCKRFLGTDGCDGSTSFVFDPVSGSKTKSTT